MRNVLTFLMFSTLAVGCDSVLNGGGITEEDVENIEPGDANGIIFTGTWALKTEVTESTCGGLFEILPGSDVLFGEGFLGTAPTPGAKGEETITFAQSGGELTRVFDEFGDTYLFRGGVQQNGDFEYGQFFDISLIADLRYIELVSGKVELSDGANGRLTGTSTRRYSSGIIDCTATMRLDGERTTLGGN